MEMINEKICLQRQKTIDERCCREQKDIEKIELNQDEFEKRNQALEELSIKMGEILKNHDENIENHDKRIVKLESVFGERWNLLVNYVIAGMVGAIIAASMNIMLGG